MYLHLSVEQDMAWSGGEVPDYAGVAESGIFE